MIMLSCLILLGFMIPVIPMAIAGPPREIVWQKTDVREQDLYFNSVTTKTVISRFTVTKWEEFGGYTYLEYDYQIDYPTGGVIHVSLYHHSWRYDAEVPHMDSHSYFWWYNGWNSNWDTNLFHIYTIGTDSFSFSYTHVKI